MAFLYEYRADRNISANQTIIKTLSADLARTSFSASDIIDNNVTDPESSQYNLISEWTTSLTAYNNTVLISFDLTSHYAWTGYRILQCYRDSVPASNYDKSNMVGELALGHMSGTPLNFQAALIDRNAGANPTYYFTYRNVENGNVAKFINGSTVTFITNPYIDLSEI